MRAELLGNVTVDINETGQSAYTGPGGSVFFMAKTFENLRVSATIISPRGTDFPENYLPQVRFIPLAPSHEKTLLFRNIYTGGRRKQQVENYASILSVDWPEYLKSTSSGSDIVAIGPILNNLDAVHIKATKAFSPQSFFVLLPQGFYRQVDENDNITPTAWKEEEAVVGLFDFVSLSVEDLENADKKGEEWSGKGPLVAVTKAGEGVSLYQKRQRKDYPAFKVAEFVDPTGAGDIFAAAFAYGYLESRNIEAAVEFAQAAAALSLRQRSDQLQYSYQDIINFAAEQNRPIAL